MSVTFIDPGIPILWSQTYVSKDLLINIQFEQLYLVTTYNSSLVAQRLKRLPAMQETWVWSLGWEDSLEKEMATHSSILA